MNFRDLENDIVIDDGSNVGDDLMMAESIVDKITPDNLPLEFVKQYLRIEQDFTEDDLEIVIAIRSAQRYVRNYIKIEDDKNMDVGLMPIVLSVVAYFYENKSPMMKSTEKIDAMFSMVLDVYREDVL